MLDINLNIYTDFSFVVNIRLCLILGSIPYACSVGNFILLIILSVTNKYILVIGIRLKKKLHFCDVCLWWPTYEVLDHVRMPAVKCKSGVMTKAKSLYTLNAIKVPCANYSDAS